MLHTLMPETIEVSTATSTRSQPPSATIVGDVQNELMAADKQRRQQFLLISRRTTTTVFANTHDQRDGAAEDDGGDVTVIVRAPPSKPVRRQFTCLPDPTVASPAMETHFEWRQQDRGQGRGQKGPVLLMSPSRSRNDNMLLGGGVTGTNKIRLKIVW